MSGRFRRGLPARTRVRRGAHVDPVVEAPAGPSLAALVATMLLFDRDPAVMIDQVRAWLAEDDRG